MVAYGGGGVCEDEDGLSKESSEDFPENVVKRDSGFHDNGEMTIGLREESANFCRNSPIPTMALPRIAKSNPADMLLSFLCWFGEFCEKLIF